MWGKFHTHKCDAATMSCVNCSLTCIELKRALAPIKKAKVSTGLDIVSYQKLREVPESFFEDSTRLLPEVLGRGYDSCWAETCCPCTHHKQGKTRKEIASYWSISLTSQFGKVYERVIKRRLEYFCETKKVFPACQAGFRRRRGVTVGGARRESDGEEKGSPVVLL